MSWRACFKNRNPFYYYESAGNIKQLTLIVLARTIKPCHKVSPIILYKNQYMRRLCLVHCSRAFLGSICVLCVYRILQTFRQVCSRCSVDIRTTRPQVPTRLDKQGADLSHSSPRKNRARSAKYGLICALNHSLVL